MATDRRRLLRRSRRSFGGQPIPFPTQKKVGKEARLEGPRGCRQMPPLFFPGTCIAEAPRAEAGKKQKFQLLGVRLGWLPEEERGVFNFAGVGTP
ncbi:hypothetical protein HKI87_18g87150 [Chloropicon roscoffensis]|uniref:Uncharacterized protein n=1 Tax=Chloropicon roscoffensis TaxID=1461544 RepID=A0AAX4PM67_9CHLO